MNNGVKGKDEKSLPLWNQAITDAQAKLEAAEKKVKQLKYALATFKRNREQGRAWPGESAPQD